MERLNIFQNSILVSSVVFCACRWESKNPGGEIRDEFKNKLKTEGINCKLQDLLSFKSKLNKVELHSVSYYQTIGETLQENLKGNATFLEFIVLDEIMLKKFFINFEDLSVDGEFLNHGWFHEHCHFFLIPDFVEKFQKIFIGATKGAVIYERNCDISKEKLLSKKLDNLLSEVKFDISKIQYPLSIDKEFNVEWGSKEEFIEKNKEFIQQEIDSFYL